MQTCQWAAYCPTALRIGKKLENKHDERDHHKDYVIGIL
jgi:hypothetical protein